MPNMDFTEVMTDPDLVDLMQYVRQTQTMTPLGTSSVTAVTADLWGIVTSGGTRLLRRIAEGELNAGAITVHSKTRLIAGEDDITADVVAWRGKQYTVNKVRDYSHFGQGFVAADCDLIPVRG